MVDRNKYNGVIDSLQKISGHYPECGFETSIRRINDYRSQFDVKLLFVGHYNAGKTALLNGLIQRPGLLKEAQLPQTAVAAELIFDERESAFAYRHDGEKEPLTEQATTNPAKYRRLEYRLSSPGLQQVSDYTVVDTPGLDSGIEAHSKALSQYIGIGSAYILVIDQEKGGIDETTLRFVEEISNYSSQIAVLINKCDKIPSGTAESIRSSVELTLHSNGLLYPVYTVSARDSDLCEKLAKIITKFDPQSAFDAAMKRQLRTELINIASVLELTQQKLYLDTFDLDTELNTLSRAREEETQLFQAKQKEALGGLDNSTEKVVSEIRNQLITRADAVSQAIICGDHAAAEAIIVETIRPIMLASMRDISVRQLNSIASDLDFSSIQDNEDRRALTDVATSLAGNLKDLIEQGVFDTGGDSGQEQADKAKRAYRAVTGIAAILTDVIAPWAEVIIILLPDVISLLRGIFGEQSAERVSRLFVNNMVPQICNRLYPKIRENIEASTGLILKEYQSMLDEKLDQIASGMKAAEQKKTEVVSTYEESKMHLSEDMSLIRELIQKME